MGILSLEHRVCFIGTARYGWPLDPTTEKKFAMLSNLGEIHVVGFSVDARPRRFSRYARFYLLPSLPLPFLRYILMFGFGPALATWCILRHNIRVLVAQSPYEGFAAAWAKIFARALGKKVLLVVESHGDFEVSLFLQRRVLLSGFYRYLMNRAARFALRQADILRAVSTSTRQQLESWAPGKPVVQFPAWTDLDVFLEAGENRRLHGQGEGIDEKPEKLVLYVGVLIPGKGVHFLLDAFAELARAVSEARLRIVGRAENPTYASALREQVSRLGLEERVRFEAPLPQRQLAEEMTRAEVLVLPSLSEALGRVVFEAMACGTPVVGSRVGGIPDMISDGETGFLVDPGDAAALADRLRWVLRHPREARAMGRRGREFARGFFSPEDYVRNYAGLLERACEILASGAG